MSVAELRAVMAAIDAVCANGLLPTVPAVLARLCNAAVLSEVIANQNVPEAARRAATARLAQIGGSRE